ncbi:thiamine phosphate synthase [Flavobacterium sp. HNIBRBA15423]|uniref:thiamine phosphate synthase n=1 Tax=Flavobacterium sp. HNIBRBA15423 TaxID=3458683 RepID=UPI0040442236
MIVISNPEEIMNEINIIHALFENGMELFHIRKPDYSKDKMQSFISKINSKYHSKLVLHHYHDLAEEFQIKRLHFTEKDRLTILGRFLKPVRYFSTSVHSITDFNDLPNDFDYAFLSPIYPSISKENYVSTKNAFEEIKKRTNWHTKLIALGGISAENIEKTVHNGFDDIALLGTIWNSKNPIENFKKCQQIIRLF